MFKAIWNETEFCLTSLPTLTDSSREAKFSDIEIDFTGFTEEDLPVLYQEVVIKDEDDNIYLTGYVDSVDFPEFQYIDQPFLVSISLLSPYAFASKRTITKEINTVALNTAIIDLLEPLLDDGFTIEENDLNGKLVSEIFRAETMEKVLNYLANKFSFIWYIDKNKKIYLKDISKLLGQEPVVRINNKDKHYLKTIKPIKTIVDYANKLVIKDAILLSNDILVPDGTVLVNGQIYKFPYPVSISENTAYRLEPRFRIGDLYNTANSFYLWTSTRIYEIEINLDDKIITYDADIGFLGQDDDTTKKILLETDAVDPTKVIGFKWNAASETVTVALTASALTPIVFNFLDPIQVGDIKNKINTSGIIEKTIDVSGKYFTYNELLSYAESLFSQNNVATNEIQASFKGLLNDSAFMTVANNLEITKILSIYLPKFLIDGSFVITDKFITFDRETMEVRIKARNFNLNENFNDIFRSPLAQLNENDLVNVALVLYNRDKKVVLNKQIIIDGEVVSDA